MIYVSDASNLLAEWSKKIENAAYPQEYRDALFDCSFDLNNLITKSFQEQEAMNQYYQEMKADEYLTSPEFFEKDIN